MAEKLEDNTEERCGRCRQKKAEHIMVNFIQTNAETGVTIVGPAVLLCPTAAYLPTAETPSAGAVR